MWLYTVAERTPKQITGFERPANRVDELLERQCGMVQSLEHQTQRVLIWWGETVYFSCSLFNQANSWVDSRAVTGSAATMEIRAVIWGS